MTNRFLGFAFTFVVSFVLPLAVTAQVKVVDKLRIVNPSTGAVVVIEAPIAPVASQTLTLPAAVGASGELLTTSTFGASSQMQWSAAAASGASSSDRLLADIVVSDTALQPLKVSVDANKSYRIVGMLHIGTTGFPDNDNFQVQVEAPLNSTRVLVGMRCYNCPANTVGVPQSMSGTQTATSANVDPAGNGVLNGSAYSYAIEGVIDTGGTAGEIIVKSLKTDGTSEVVFSKQSYILLTEID